MRYVEDGELAIDNNAAERAIRPLAMVRSIGTPFAKCLETLKSGSRNWATRASVPLSGGNDPLILKIGRANLIRRTRHDLCGGQHTFLDQAANAMISHADRLAAADIVSHSPPFSADR